MKKISRYFLWVWVGFTLLIFSSVLISPLVFEYGSIFSIAIPLVMLINGLAFFISVFLKSKTWPYFLVVLVCAWPFWRISIRLNQPLNEKAHLSVLSYNIARLNLLKSSEDREDFNEFVKEQDADIICFQEFFAGEDLFKELENYYFYRGGRAGSYAIFSKFPIVEGGVLFFDEAKTNNIVFVDIQFRQDTFRVYNAHLESMGINPELIQDGENLKNHYEGVKLKLLRGSKQRTSQIEKLIQHSNRSKSPQIIAGDFNDTPYSYNYFKLKSLFQNSFEERGWGFGITYNGKIPFLRIDNQFFSEGFEVINFKTISDVYFSDHFPVIGKYRIKD